MNNTDILYSALAGTLASGLYLWFSNRKPPSQQTLIQESQPESISVGNKIRILGGDRLLNEPHRRAMLQQIQDRLAFTPQSYDCDVLALIIKYAEFVQQLPASESHHHSHPGGLLDHTLEVASIALRISASLEMPLHTATEDRKKLAPVWRYGLLVAAMLHDIGKTLTNLVVNLYESPESKDPIRWHPDAGDMLSIKNYYWYSVSFHEENPEYSAHSRLGWSLFNVIVPGHARNWIATTDPRLIEALRQYLTGTDIEPFDKVIKKSDSESTANNLRNGVKTRFASAKRIPIRELLMENLREMLDNQAFTIGKDAGGEVFRFDGSKIFILSKVLADKLRNHINAKGNFSIPQDNDRIFGALFECGACLPNPFDENKYNWNVCVEMKSGTHFFNGLCFEATSLYKDLLWPNEYLGKITCVEANNTTQKLIESNNIAQEIHESNHGDLKQQKSILAQEASNIEMKPTTAPHDMTESGANSASKASDSSSEELSDEDLVELAMKQLASTNEATNLGNNQPNHNHEDDTESLSEPNHDSNEQDNNEASEEQAKLPRIESGKIKNSAHIQSLLQAIPKVPDLPSGKEFATAAKSRKSNRKETTHENPKIPIPVEMSAESITSISLNTQMRPVDVGEKHLGAMQLKNRIDEYNQSGQLGPEDKHNLALKFFSWLQQGIANEEILFNNPDSVIHVVDDGVVLVTPKIFHKFTVDDRHINKESDTPTKAVQQAFEAEKMHFKSKVSGHWIAEVQPIGNKPAGQLHVYWIKGDKARSLFANLPPANPRISLKPF